MSRTAPMGWLAAMPTAFRKAVLERVEPRHIEAGRPLYLQGEEARGLYGLISGSVEVSIVSSGGGPALIYLARKGWWFGALEIFTSRPRRFQIQTRSDCELLFLNSGQVRDVCRLAPDHWQAFARLMCANYESMADAVAMMRDPSPDHRVAKALLILHFRQAEPAQCIEATQADIASIANVSVRSAASALARLERSGLVSRGYGNVTILDSNRLSQSVGDDIRF